MEVLSIARIVKGRKKKVDNSAPAAQHSRYLLKAAARQTPVQQTLNKKGAATMK